MKNLYLLLIGQNLSVDRFFAVCRTQIQVQLNSLKSKKYRFSSGNEITDLASVGKYSITRWEQYVNAAAYGPNEKVSARIPAYNSFLTSGKNFAQFYHHIDQIEQSAISSAFSIGKSLMKKSTGWFFGGSQPGTWLKILTPTDPQKLKFDLG